MSFNTLSYRKKRNLAVGIRHTKKRKNIYLSTFSGEKKDWIRFFVLPFLQHSREKKNRNLRLFFGQIISYGTCSSQPIAPAGLGNRPRSQNRGRAYYVHWVSSWKRRTFLRPYYRLCNHPGRKRFASNEYREPRGRLRIPPSGGIWRTQLGKKWPEPEKKKHQYHFKFL